jgi:cell division septum initiation protein DivIVA
MNDDLLPPHDEADATGFDIVFRGYDRRQVEDYIERVEIALTDADRLHQQDVVALEQARRQLAETEAKLIEAERRAAGQPEPSSLVGERLLSMLKLAEQEADEIVEQGHQRAAANTADLQASLERRETEVVEAHAAAEQARLDAQRDADAVRAKAHQDAEALWAKAQQEVEALWAKATEETNDFTARAEQEAAALRAATEQEAHDVEADARRQAADLVGNAQDDAERVRSEAAAQADAILRSAEQDAIRLDLQAKEHAAELVSQARRQVEDLQAQHDTITAQLEALRRSVRETTDPR